MLSLTCVHLSRVPTPRIQLNDGDGGGTSGYMEVTPSTWGSGSGSRDAGG